MRKNLGLLAALALMTGGGMAGNSNPLRPKDIDITPKTPPIPKGCTRFYFNETGECEMGQHKVYFDAMKRGNAIKKFERWKLNNQ